MIDITKELFIGHSCSQISFLTVQRKSKHVTELVWMEEKWTTEDVCVNRRIRARVVRRPPAPQLTDATNESENLMEVLWSAEDLKFLLLTDRQRAKTYKIIIKAWKIILSNLWIGSEAEKLWDEKLYTFRFHNFFENFKRFWPCIAPLELVLLSSMP